MIRVQRFPLIPFRLGQARLRHADSMIEAAEDELEEAESKKGDLEVRAAVNDPLFKIGSRRWDFRLFPCQAWPVMWR